MESASKKMRMDDPNMAGGMMGQPSNIVCAVGIPTSCIIADVFKLFQRYGNLVDCQIVQCGRVALVEYDDINVAMKMVETANTTPFYVGTSQVNLSYFNPPNTAASPIRNDVGGPSGVLHFNILNCSYPITVDVLNTICSPHGKVNRILVGKKNVEGTLESFVEFSKQEEAQSAMDALSGADIYSDCCTLEIKPSKLYKLQVTKNDSESWDYTTPKESLLGNHAPKPLLGDGSMNSAPSGGGGGSILSRLTLGMNFQTPQFQPMAQQQQNQQQQNQQQQPMGGGNAMGMAMGQNQQQMMGPMGMMGGPMGGGGGPNMGMMNNKGMGMGGGGGGGAHDDFMQSHPRPGNMMSQGGGPPGGGPKPYAGGPDHGGSGSDVTLVFEMGEVVVMFYKMSTTTNCDHLFNLCCLYGNVARIKFLKSREGTAMVQMGTSEQAAHVVTYLSGLKMFGHVMEVCPSKQTQVVDHPNPVSLADGTPIGKNYMSDTNNRFRTASHVARARILPPAKTLYFFNAPPRYSPTQICDVFTSVANLTPREAYVFEHKEYSKVSVGLVEFNTLEEAVDALALVNHTEISVDGVNHPYHFKLAWSPKSIEEAIDGSKTK